MLDTLGAGDILLADAAYDSDEWRATVEARGAFANIKPMGRRKTTQVFSRYLYKSRNLVERFFNKLKKPLGCRDTVRYRLARVADRGRGDDSGVWAKGLDGPGEIAGLCPRRSFSRRCWSGARVLCLLAQSKGRTSRGICRDPASRRDAGLNALYKAKHRPGTVIEAACWRHTRCTFFILADVTSKVRSRKPVMIAPLALEAVRRFNAIFEAERSLNGLSADLRREGRQRHVTPFVEDLERRAWPTPRQCAKILYAKLVGANLHVGSLALLFNQQPAFDA